MRRSNRFEINGNLTTGFIHHRDGRLTTFSFSTSNPHFMEVTQGHGWQLTTKGYVQDSNSKPPILLHRLLNGLGPKKEDPRSTDHRDGNPLNNLDSNLRICTNQENSWNKNLRRDSASGLRGAQWHKVNQTWVAYGRDPLTLKRVHLGVFSTKEEAHIAYIHYAKETQGEFFRPCPEGCCCHDEKYFKKELKFRVLTADE